MPPACSTLPRMPQEHSAEAFAHHCDDTRVLSAAARAGQTPRGASWWSAWRRWPTRWCSTWNVWPRGRPPRADPLRYAKHARELTRRGAALLQQHNELHLCRDVVSKLGATMSLHACMHASRVTSLDGGSCAAARLRAGAPLAARRTHLAAPDQAEAVRVGIRMQGTASREAPKGGAWRRAARQRTWFGNSKS